jgi:hypothetical protein
VDDNRTTSQEYNAFKKGPEIAAVIRSVSNRLGFTKSISYGMYVFLVLGLREWRTYSN